MLRLAFGGGVGTGRLDVDAIDCDMVDYARVELDTLQGSMRPGVYCSIKRALRIVECCLMLSDDDSGLEMVGFLCDLIEENVYSGPWGRPCLKARMMLLSLRSVYVGANWVDMESL